MSGTSAKKLAPKRAAEWQPIFLEVLSKTANVGMAAKRAGVSRVAVYKAKHAHEEFAAAWDEAMRAAVEDLEAEAFRRAKAQSDTLLIFLLKSHKPDLYRETVRHELIRKEADRWAREFGLDPDEVIREAEAIARSGV